MHPKRGILTIKYPLEGGLVVNWDDYEKIVFEMLYNELRLAPEEHPLFLLANPSLLAHRNLLEKLLQLFIETFNVPSFSLIPSDVAAWKGAELTHPGYRPSPQPTFVLNCGYDSTTATIVYHGRSVIESRVVLPIGGGHLTGHLGTVMQKTVGDFYERPWVALETAKRQHCYVSPLPIAQWRQLVAGSDPQQNPPFQIDNFIEAEHPILLSGEFRYEIPEFLFSTDSPDRNIADALLKSYHQVRQTVPKPSTLLLCGGGALFPGLAKRLFVEMARRGIILAIANPTGQRKYLPFVGGSMLACSALPEGASLPFFTGVDPITLEKYDEIGPALIHDHIKQFVHSIQD